MSHVVLFDIDGTLIDTRGAGRAALIESMARAFGVDTDCPVPLHGHTDRAIVRSLFQTYNLVDSEAHWERFVKVYLECLPNHLRLRQGVVLPGVHRLLDDLAARDLVHVGLLTGNMLAGARAKLSHFGLLHHFSFGGFGDQSFDRDDVARRALVATRDHLARPIPGQQIWVIGDTPLDVACARAIGARVVAVATGPHSARDLAHCQPDLVLENLAEPAGLLQHLAA